MSSKRLSLVMSNNLRDPVLALKIRQVMKGAFNLIRNLSIKHAPKWTHPAPARQMDRVRLLPTSISMTAPRSSPGLIDNPTKINQAQFINSALPPSIQNTFNSNETNYYDPGTGEFR
jgi:hypothetical protein